MIKSLFLRDSYYLSRFHSATFLEQLVSLGQQEKPDIIQLELLHCAYYGLEIKKRLGIPIVLRLHNLESSLVGRFAGQTTNILASAYARIESSKIRSYERRVTPHFDRVLTISEDDNSQLKELQPDAISAVVPSGVDTDFFSPLNVQEEPASILLLAAFHWLPNQDSFWWFIHEILPLIIRQKPTAKLSVVGMNPTEKMTSFRHPNVTIVGPVDDVREHIAKHQVAVVPLRVGGGIRLKLLELFAMGKAVVSTSIGCEGLGVSDNSHLKVEDSAESFARAVVHALEHPSEREALGKAARGFVRRNYSWEAILPKYEELCLKIAKVGSVKSGEPDI